MIAIGFQRNAVSREKGLQTLRGLEPKPLKKRISWRVGDSVAGLVLVTSSPLFS